jgi:predicted thioesterase
MQQPPIGTTHTLEVHVEPEHTIDFDGMPRVLSTPVLVGLLERTAREALAPFLETGESSVGISIEIQHLAPTPLGQDVACRARVIHVEKRVITFQIDASGAHGLLARGLHKRRVLSVERFAAAVKRLEA